MRQQKEQQNKVDTERAFNLIKQDEKIEEANKTWWGLIKNNKKLMFLKNIAYYMNNIVKYGMYFIILTAVGMLYERYNRKFNHFDEVRQYELIKKYLLNDSSLASSETYYLDSYDI